MDKNKKSFKLDDKNDRDLIGEMKEIRNRIEGIKSIISSLIEESSVLSHRRNKWFDKAKDRLKIKIDVFGEFLRYNPESKEIKIEKK